MPFLQNPVLQAASGHLTARGGEVEGPQFLSSCLCQAWFQVGQVKLLTRLQMSKTGQNPLKK